MEIMLKLNMDMLEQSYGSTLLEASLNKVMFSGRHNYELMMDHFNNALEAYKSKEKIKAA